jgi:hypothetical protein
LQHGPGAEVAQPFGPGHERVAAGPPVWEWRLARLGALRAAGTGTLKPGRVLNAAVVMIACIVGRGSGEGVGEWHRVGVGFMRNRDAGQHSKCKQRRQQTSG